MSSGSFRKTMFGGFREDDVLGYIRELHQRIAVLERELKDTKDQLHKKDGELAQLANSRESHTQALEEKEKQISLIAQEAQRIQELKEDYEKQNAAMAQMMEQTKKEAMAILDSARQKALEIDHEAARTASQVVGELESAGDYLLQLREKTEKMVSDFRTALNGPKRARDEVPQTAPAPVVVPEPAPIMTAPAPVVAPEPAPIMTAPAPAVSPEPAPIMTAPAPEPAQEAGPGEVFVKEIVQDDPKDLAQPEAAEPADAQQTPPAQEDASLIDDELFRRIANLRAFAQQGGFSGTNE